MASKPTYEELEQRVKQLEQETEKRKQAKEALRKSEHQIKQYLAIAGVIFVALDDEGNITLINECGLETLGYRREELLGKNWFKTCLPHEFQKDVLNVYHQLMKGEIEPVEYYENSILRRDGRKCIIAWHNTILQDPEGKTVGVFSSGEDITERKRMEQALKKYRTILETIEDSYLEVDLEGNFQFLNNSFCELLGCPEDALIGRNNREFMDKANAEKVFRIFHNVYETKKSVSGESWEFIRTDGTRKHIEASVSLIIDAEGERIGFRGIGRDVTDQIKIRESLALNEARFRDISLSMADWIWEVDKDGKYIFTTGNLKDVLGYEHDEILGKTPFDFMPESEAARVKDFFSEVAAKKQPIVDLKNWNLRKDGSQVCLLTNGVPIISDTGELLGYRGVDKDITRDLLIEKKLKQSLKTTEKIIDNLPIGMMIVGKDKKINRINRRALEIIGFDSEKELIGRVCHTNVCPAQKGKRPITDLGKIVDRSEKFVLHKDGRRIPILKTALPITINDEEVVLETFMDITELKRAEKALRDSEKKHRLIMDTCADPFVVYDNKGRVTYLNPAFTEIFGWTSEKVLGKRIDFVPDDAMPETQKAIKAVLDGGNLTWFESRRFTKDGQILDVRIGAAMIQDESGAPAGIVVNLQDITSQKQTLAELEIAKKVAEDASRTKSEFLANMSHEIRTPMNGIIGMTELTLGTDLTPEQREYLSMVKMSADTLLTLINDILDFSKIEAGKLELEAIDFNLRNTLENAADTLALKAYEKGLELACHIRPDVPTALVGDPGRLCQIIVNLAGNSLKFTEQGEVVIRVAMEAESDDSVQLHFMVLDTGIGIPQDKLASIFESFEQVDGTTTRKYGGTGLGLSISRQLVELMGGKIWVESPANCQLKIEDCRLEDHSEMQNRNKHQSSIVNRQSQGGPGSIFNFTARFELGSLKKTSALRLEHQDLSGLPVLIVDDNYTNRMLLLEMLTAWGLVPTAAADGKEALALSERAFYSEKPFRLVLMDMQMPELDGFDVAKMIKAAPFGADMKIIMISSMGQRGDSARCREAEISGYLSKPIKQSDLFDAIMMTMGLAAEDKAAIITRHTVYEARERLTILLAEDNVVNQILATKLLETRGHQVILAPNGKEAVNAFKKGDFDLILMDVQMPEMDGFEATGHIRALEQQATDDRQQAASIPIVAMTAHTMKGDREKCLESGMDDYISKPINVEELFRVIEKFSHKLKNHKKKKPFPSLKKTNARSKEVFDLSKAMEVVAGSKEIFKEIANMFLENSPASMAQIREGIVRGDALALEHAAHSLKGSVGHFGARRAFEASYHLEKLGREKEMGEADNAFSTLEKELTALTSEMKRTLKEMKSEDSNC